MDKDVRNPQRLVNLFAALFHDIGKFHFGGLSPDNQYTHAESGARFVDEQLSRFACLQPGVKDIAELIRNHHASGKDQVLEMANHFDLPASNQFQEETSNHQPLESIFTALAGTKSIPKWYLKPSVLKTPTNAAELETLIMPAESFASKSYTEACNALWKNFTAEIAQLPDNITPEALIGSLYYLIWKYTSRIPAGTGPQRSNIALFDHLRLSAAIADALFNSEDTEKQLLLIEGDISGIQNFIYRLAEPDTKKPQMAKRLRGRSFYLTILSETVSQYILEQLELFNLNMIINGGGHFLIIAPNTSANQAKLQEIEKRINTYLYRQFEGQLSLLIAWQPFALTELKHYDTSIRQLGMLIANQKNQKYLSILEEIFQPGNEQPQDICAICHNDCLKSPCDFCKETLAFGAELVYARYLVRVKAQQLNQVNRLNGTVDFDFFNERWIPVRGAKELVALLQTFGRDQVERVTVLELNPKASDTLTDKSFIANTTCPLAYGFFFVGNYAPIGKDQNVLEFEELAMLHEGEDLAGNPQTKNQKSEDIYKMLGVLRMDMDNLGKVFENLGALSSVITLSREMHFFFSAPINYLAQKYHLYVTYSGGDDLFIVGRWNYCIDLACELQSLLTQWTSGLSQISISGAIFMCKPTYPIRNAAAAAKELLEDKAKHYESEGQKKNACYLFDDVYHWKDIKSLLRYGSDLTKLIEEDKLPRSFVHSLLTLCKKYNPTDQAEATFSTGWIGSVRHLIHYALARRKVNDVKIKQYEAHELEESEAKVVGPLARLLDPNLFRRLRIPASYALYSTRKQQIR